MIYRALEVLADCVRTEKCILFLGAGAHAPPPKGSLFSYPVEERPPVGAALSSHLAQVCDFTSRFPGADVHNLQRVAWAYEMDISRSHLVRAIANAVAVGKAPSVVLRALARMNFPMVITTNYDQLFEQALLEVGKRPRVHVYNPASEPTPSIGNPTSESPIIYKLHGDLDRAESVVITEEDYVQFVARMFDTGINDPIPLRLKYHLTEWTRLLISYSLKDFNLRLLFKLVDQLADVPEMYSVDFRPDPLLMEVWQSGNRKVKFISEDIWTVVPRLYELLFDEELTDIRGT